MKRILVLTTVLTLIMMLCGCQKYQAADFIGKTSAEIIAQYGKFDCLGKPADKNGSYRTTFCGYTVKERRVGFFGTDPEVLFFIRFDENGIAVECYEGYRPGG